MKRRLFSALLCGVLASVLTLSALADADDFAVSELEDACGDIENVNRDGVNVTHSSVYRHSQATFVKAYYSVVSESIGTVYVEQYATVYGDEGLVITIYSYSGRISTRERQRGYSRRSRRTRRGPRRR